MFARFSFGLFLLLSASCMMEAEEALEFPNYLQASVTLPGDITVEPVFSMAENYAIAAVDDSLYHMELRHGRVHGRTGLPGTVTGLTRGSDGSVFAVAGGNICRLDGFQVAASVQLNGQCAALSASGDNPLLLMEDGTIELRSSADLSLQATGSSQLESITCFQ